MEPEIFVLTEKKIEEIFKKWDEEYKTNPELFNKSETSDEYSKNCTRYFIEKFKEL